ncbi:oxidative stress survival, Svf1-like protein [Dothidotthia symphoricarpi CBS 119687]|uniref:Oxidative stress survival, Svf1-like protein n=1 Tax=Dothidotthia symphoricarpi CBS 119687 TaxID=1392245 RepID=A0A6A6AFC2_9PLEO|nr:oxidative stress survival, Svf1-like protein [Dothidotthia symphoricarpi CBS 119687]KAF2129644.1 oxidative stress survival, Svf1-like protein [Dothidotthia symphoricarpi CBS 119687]
MFNWAKSTLAAAVGTQEPIYGPEAVQPVGKNAGEPAYTELTKQNLKWASLDYTNVETQSFYIFTEDGHIAMLQVLYSNVAGLRVTAQFNCKLFYPNNEKPALWASNPLSNYGFDEAHQSFHADSVSVELSEDGSFYTIKAAVSETSLVNVKFTRTAPGFMGGKNGTTNFGTDPKQPWGSMHHHFWPRASAEGSIITKAGEVKMNGRGMFSHALQGMKPHHAASRWNFVNFQSPSFSAILMEFTTPPSYGSSVVRVSGIATEGKLLIAGINGEAKHTAIKQDSDNDWPEPTSTSYNWVGKTEDGQEVTAELAGSLGPRWDRVDVMAEVPGFVKAIVATAAGTKPYIYQYAPKLTIKVKVGDEVTEEEGTLFTEATFIS